MRHSVELRHGADGWVAVDLDGTSQVGARPTDLPQGRYDAIRIKYLTSIPADEGATSEGAAEVTWIETEALVLEDFCIGSKDPGLALQLVRDPRSDRMSARVTLDAPCEDSSESRAVAGAEAEERGGVARSRRDRPQ